ncbi:unnamed protein product [Orchesella dallaii]|uniref:Peptidase S1 domain-containing protein n=1 Tax=Orchesella dallaii TaxID=48710 RepID=A0ABP1Q5T6_9HEXA
MFTFPGFLLFHTLLIIGALCAPSAVKDSSTDADYNYDNDDYKESPADPEYSYSYNYDYNTNTATTSKTSGNGTAKTTVTTVTKYKNADTTTKAKSKPTTTSTTTAAPTTSAPHIILNSNDLRHIGGSNSQSFSNVAVSSNHFSVKCPPIKLKSGVKLDCLSRIHKDSESGFVVAVSDCQQPQIEGTDATYECETFYESSSGVARQYRKCRANGEWSGSDDHFICSLECGQQNPSGQLPLITSGDVGAEAAFPWHAALFIRERREGSQGVFGNSCGGTLISARAILTAAHCVTLPRSLWLRDFADLRVDLGRYYREREDEYVQKFEVQNIVSYPAYNPFSYESDIAIIILKEKAKIGFHVRPICYPKVQNAAFDELYLADGAYATVAGWGIDETGQFPNELRIAKLRVISYLECIQSLEESNIGSSNVKSTTFCASNKNGTNVCRGDSGSGAYFGVRTPEGRTRWYLQGLVSVGINVLNQCDPRKVSIFTKIGPYSDWIVRILSENDAL